MVIKSAPINKWKYFGLEDNSLFPKILLLLLMLIAFMSISEELFMLGGRTLTAPLMALLGFFLILDIIVSEKLVIPKPLVFLLMLFFSWSYLSVTWAETFSRWHVLRLAEVSIFFLAFQYICSNDRKFRIIILVIFLAGALFSCYGLYKALLLQDFGRQVLVDSQNPNNFSRSLTLSLLAAPLLWDWLKNTWTRSFLLLGSMVIVTMIFLTGSKGAWIALLITFITFTVFISLKQKKINSRLLMTAVLLFTLIFFVILMGGELFARFEAFVRFTDLMEEGIGTATGRTEIWSAGFKLIQDNFLFGVGLNNFAYWVGREPHSIYISILAEQGVIGLIIFLLFMGIIIWDLLKFSKDIRAQTALLFTLSVLFGGLAATNYFLRYFWIALSLGACIPRIIRVEKLRKNSTCKN
ncbi:O-antigen ligase family protein [Candidatus Contubernalis alkaliaceticus]|uniref:O-antigen ligase family protein n=1 Tax=Candidatus Contubernalis alkaliaceticus TaxID=338645 RepID=UPI001F4C46A6|nr:O-antigen ligase family protein [Candidatus Contubernalis alkalaceticus]UNC93591.1 O-antigen ligase family protein [Candidatus Contubernalis alkalaceticus]